MMKVTYITSCCGEVSYLDKTLRSLLGQSFKGDLRVVVCFDGTKGDDIDWIMEKHGWIYGVTNDKAMGKSYAVNKALREVDTRYVSLIDSDDIAMLNKTRTQLDFLKANRDYAYCGSTYFQFGGQPVREVQKPFRIDSLLESFLYGPPFLYSSLMFDVERLGAMPWLDESLSCAMDYQLGLSLLNRCRGANIQSPLVAYRVRTGSITRSSKRKDQLVNHANLLFDYIMPGVSAQEIGLFSAFFALGLSLLAQEAAIADVIFRVDPHLNCLQADDGMLNRDSIKEGILSRVCSCRVAGDSCTAFLHRLLEIVYLGLSYSLKNAR